MNVLHRHLGLVIPLDPAQRFPSVGVALAQADLSKRSSRVGPEIIPDHSHGRIKKLCVDVLRFGPVDHGPIQISESAGEPQDVGSPQGKDRSAPLSRAPGQRGRVAPIDEFLPLFPTGSSGKFPG